MTTGLTCVQAAGTDLSNEPGIVWAQRASLSKEARTRIDQAGIIGFNGNEIVLHTPTVKMLSTAYPDAKPMLEKFQEALALKQIQPSDDESLGECNDHNKCDKQTQRPSVAAGVRIKRSCMDMDAMANVTPPSNSSNTRRDGSVSSTTLKVMEKKHLPNMTHCKSSFEMDTVVRDLTNSMEASVPSATNDTSLKSTYDNVAKTVRLMSLVPGLSSLDRITLYDHENKTMTGIFIDIPRNTYRGMTLNHVIPDHKFKFLLVDGGGFKAGGNTSRQHSCRLYCHRKHCMNSQCQVLGCGSDPAFRIFQHAASDELKLAYEKHWRTSNRHALKSKSHCLRIMAGTVA